MRQGRRRSEHGFRPDGHVALAAHGLHATRDALRAAGIRFDESPLKGTHRHQVFVEDPLGLRLELNFDMEAEGLLAQPLP
jgi:catechol 2,3-dioxygenase-like lactoylglutathione lyase family enzyme